jgi:hypothetical protein
MATNMVTDSMRAHADMLLSRSHLWTRAVRKRDGLALVIFPSSRTGTSYYSAESGCTCRGFLYRGICAHVVAIRDEAEAAHEAVGPRTRYEDLFPSDDLVSAF